MVFQNYALYPHMRVWDNLAFALKLRRTPKPALQERVGSVAGVLGLKELIDRKPGALSGGQRQRVAIGRAMVREPQAYLMDEPLSNLDAKLRVGMRAELARLHERLGVTTVYVTHDQVEAMTLGDRVAVMRDGTVQQCDTPERLYEEPANVFVAAFMGSPAMNLAPGELRGGRLTLAGVEIPLASAPRHEGAVIAGVRPTDLRPDPEDGAPRAARRARGRRAARRREPRDLPGRGPAPGGRGGGGARRGDRGGRGDAARRRRPRALHRGDPGAAAIRARRGRRVRRVAGGDPPVRPGLGGRAAVIPPYAGLFGQEEATRPGLSVADAALRLWRLAYAHRRLHALAVDLLPGTPEWEVKCALGLHLWLDAEHATALERRVNELRHPSVDVGVAPDAALALAFDELDHVRDTGELLAAGYLVARAAVVEELRAYLGRHEPARRPSVGADRRGGAARRGARARVGTRGRRGGAGGERLAGARRRAARRDGRGGGRIAPPRCARRPDRRCAIRRCGATRASSIPSTSPRRSTRICEDEARPPDERAYALAYKRLREIDVPEWMAPIIADAGGEPFERRRELSRQLWDEVRHAMMGQAALERQGVRFHAYPIEIQGSMALNTRFTPREAHLMLWVIEQDLMAAATGKKHELEIAALHGDPLLMTFQDFDWADEVLHARTGRRWIVASFPSRDAAEAAARDVWRRYDVVAAELAERSEQAEWWPAFLAAMRAGAPVRDS